MESDTKLLISFIVCSILSYDVPSGAITARPTIDLSSSGASSEGNVGSRYHAMPNESRIITKPSQRSRKNLCNERSYALLSAMNHGSVLRYNHPWEVFAFRRYALIIGESVRATNAEIKTEPATTMANSLNSFPVIPP